MATEEILLRFLVIITVIFFLPKVINRFYTIPSPLTEIFLGILLGIFLPQYFYLDDMLQILAAIGIVTLFVYAGLEVDSELMIRKKSFFLENLLIHLIVFLIVGWSMKAIFSLSAQVAFLVALALTTPSASYIFSSLERFSGEKRKLIEGKVITGEVAGIFLMVMILRLNNILALITTLALILLLIFLLPILLKFLYRTLFSKLVGSEFSFIFVVAVISAFITDFMGIHFLVGAFIAGLISRRFIQDIVADKQYAHITHDRGRQIKEGFGFFALTFIPFYFFSVGLRIDKSMLAMATVALAVALCASISWLRILLISLHRFLRIREGFRHSTQIASAMIPTLVFTFVIAELLLENFGISHDMFSALMLYGVLTAIASIAIVKTIRV